MQNYELYTRECVGIFLIGEYVSDGEVRHQVNKDEWVVEQYSCVHCNDRVSMVITLLRQLDNLSMNVTVEPVNMYVDIDPTEDHRERGHSFIGEGFYHSPGIWDVQVTCEGNENFFLVIQKTA
jgi:hypothetical protein